MLRSAERWDAVLSRGSKLGSMFAMVPGLWSSIRTLHRVRNTERSRPIQELKRVNRRRSLAYLEVELRRSDLARLTGFGNGLAALDGIAALHQQFTGMRIGGDVTVGMPNQNEIAITLELISGIGDDAVFGRLHRGAFRHRQIDDCDAASFWLLVRDLPVLNHSPKLEARRKLQ